MRPVYKVFWSRRSFDNDNLVNKRPKQKINTGKFMSL